MSRTTLQLSKQNFKFSAAHFLIFDQHRAERLHGHNYQVRLEIDFASQANANGYFADFNEFKKITTQVLSQWDEMVLLPKLHPDIQTKENGPSLEVQFRERKYVFPKNEVVLLPIFNTSTELLSKLLAETLMGHFTSKGVSGLTVYVEETLGQGASTTLRN